MFSTRGSLRLVAMGAAIAAAGIAATPAQAQTATNQWSFSGNTCGGTGGINNCYATTAGTVVQGNPGTVGSSPLIARIEGNENGTAGTPEVSTLFSAVTGGEFNVSYMNTTTNPNQLSFTYSAGVGDPAIHYVGIFQANTYDLFYYVGGITSGTFNLSTYFPNNSGWSHIDFYDTSGPVPEPATWAMMLFGFGAIGFALRRRRSLLAASA